MKIYFLRHGEANWPEWNKADTERPLTKKGHKEVEQVGAFLRELEPKLDLVLSSPLPRALQTAEIVAEHLRVQLRKEPLLAKGFSIENLPTVLKRQKEGNLMLVGHEPDFSQVIRELTGSRVKLVKAGVAMVELEDGENDGRLLWLIPPKIAKA